MKKLPPYGKRLTVPSFPIIVILAGEPESWNHAREREDHGLKNTLCLPDPDNVTEYEWPIRDCYVTVILFIAVSPDTESKVLSCLCLYDPLEVAIRHWPSDNIVVRRRTCDGR